MDALNEDYAPFCRQCGALIGSCDHFIYAGDAMEPYEGRPVPGDGMILKVSNDAVTPATTEIRIAPNEKQCGGCGIVYVSGHKCDAGKARFDLIPPGPLKALADVFAMGARKYKDRNWETGMAWGRVFAAMQRHAWAFWNGEERDPVDGQPHLASVVWCGMVLMEFAKTHPELDDRSIAPKA